MSINSVLNYSPFLSLPYAGTEDGEASNTFCQGLSLLNGGPGFSIAVPAPGSFTATPGENWTGAGGQTTAAVAFSSTTSVGGSGMTATFTVDGGGIDQVARNITAAIVISPGSGFKEGDTITWSAADIGAAIQAVYTQATAVTVNAELVYTLSADSVNQTSLVVYTDSFTTGWQFEAKGSTGTNQTITVVVSNDNITGGDYDVSDYSIVANATSTSVPAAYDRTKGPGACYGTIDHIATDNTERVTVTRFVPAGFELLDANISVRRAKRQLVLTA
jgi:hypothetical protein